MKRRAFLQGMLGGAVAASLGARGSCMGPSGPGPLNELCIVDAHCHIFNANDIPVEGFIKNAVLKELQYPLAPLVEALDWILQDAAPGFEEENVFLDRLLAGEIAAKTIDDQVEAHSSYDEFLDYLRSDRPEAYAEVQRVSDPSSKELSDGLLFQVFQWIRLLMSTRYEIVDTLLNIYSEVKLFTPSMLDFGPWLDDVAVTSISEQVVLYEKLVRLFEGRLHPMIGYDPLRDVTDFGSPPGAAFELVKVAAMEMGFVGVKLYPGMGFRPSGNAELRPYNPIYREMDDAMDRLFEWAEANDVPITLHSASTNSSHRGFGERADPRHWNPVLSKYPRLRVNFGHFGGDAQFVRRGEDSWTWDIAKLMDAYENVYADAAFFDVGLQEATFGLGDNLVEEFLDGLGALFDAFPVVKSRLMYASDWHELYAAPGANEYLHTFESRFRARFPGEVPDVMGMNALRWLGLDGEPSGNRERLTAYYDRHEIPFPNWWRA